MLVYMYAHGEGGGVRGMTAIYNFGATVFLLKIQHLQLFNTLHRIMENCFLFLAKVITRICLCAQMEC